MDKITFFLKKINNFLF